MSYSERDQQRDELYWRQMDREREQDDRFMPLVYDGMPKPEPKPAAPVAESIPDDGTPVPNWMTFALSLAGTLILALIVAALL